MFRSVLRPSSGVNQRALRNYYMSACLPRRIPVCGGMLSVIYKYLYYSLQNVVLWDIGYYTRPQPTTLLPPRSKVKPEAVNAVVSS